MSPLELITWSMALGAIAAVAVARAADLIVRPSRSQVRAVAYHGTVFLLVLLLSGVLQQAGVPAGRPLHVAQVLAGPVCVGLANYWVRGWLNAHQRDRIMFQVLRASAWAVPLAGVACLALPLEQQLLAAAGASLLGSTITLWLTARAWLMGDRPAAAMAVAHVLLLLALAGLYALTLSPDTVGMVWQGAAAAGVAIGNGIAGFVLWRRERHEWKTRQADGRLAQFDPVTRLHGGVALVRKLIHAQRRRRRTRRDGAVLAILVFDLDKVAAQAGSAGLNEMLIAIASRIQRQVGVVNPVGRYWDRCFISLVETIHSPAWLRTLGLRVSTSLRRPIEVTGLDGRRIEVRADIGVGVVHLSARQAAVEDILHDAQRMAEAARHMPSRAATMDAFTGEVVPVEEANLGPRRHGHASLVPHAVAALRAART